MLAQTKHSDKNGVVPHKNGVLSNILPLPNKSHAKPSVSVTQNQSRLKPTQNETHARTPSASRASSASSSLSSKSKDLTTRSSNTDLSLQKRSSSRGSTSGASSHQKFSFNKENGIVKFFLRGRPINLYMPSSFMTENTNEFKFDTEAKIKAPNLSLKLDWVYGYRGKDCRSNLFQIESGEIVYFIASVVVLYNLEQKTQRHYLGMDGIMNLKNFKLKIFINSLVVVFLQDTMMI